jgi:phospholipid/cholesterol/gamma-HCH transport system ATP-binding protein
MIKLSGVTKAFGDLEVLKGINLEVSRGDSMVLIGGSGSGKSLLLKTMIGLVAPDEGLVEIDGKDASRMRTAERRAFDDRFGLLFQYGGLFDSLPVWHNVAFKQLQAGDVNNTQARELAAEKLAIVGLGAEVAELYPAELSGGMQKRVGLARAIATSPEILFLDEPTAGLDPIMCNIIYEMILKSVNELGATSFVITSDMAGAQKISNRMAMLHEGRIVWDGATGEIGEAEHPEVHRFLASQSGRSGDMPAAAAGN